MQKLQIFRLTILKFKTSCGKVRSVPNQPTYWKSALPFDQESRLS
jgi:hypothetical protein